MMYLPMFLYGGLPLRWLNPTIGIWAPRLLRPAKMGARRAWRETIAPALACVLLAQSDKSRCSGGKAHGAVSIPVGEKENGRHRKKRCIRGDSL